MLNLTQLFTEQGLVVKLAGEDIVKAAQAEAKKHGPCEVIAQLSVLKLNNLITCFAINT